MPDQDYDQEVLDTEAGIKGSQAGTALRTTLINQCGQKVQEDDKIKMMGDPVTLAKGEASLKFKEPYDHEKLQKEATTVLRKQICLQEEAVKLQKESAEGNIWVSFVVALTKEGSTHVSVIPRNADLLMKAFKKRYRKT